MKIAVLGQVDIDRNVSENATYTSAGSPAMYIDKIYRQFPDCEVTIVAPYGDDFSLYLNKVDIYPKKPNNKKTLVYENVSKSGKRSQKAFNREEAQPIPVGDGLKNILNVTDICFFAPILPNFTVQYLKSVVAGLNPSALKVLLPQGFYRNFDEKNDVVVRDFAEAGEILPMIDLVFVSDQDHPDMDKTALAWSKSNYTTIVMTAGKRGALAFQRGSKTALPTKPLREDQIVDSVGAGDVFAAGFSYRFHQTRDIKKSGDFANRLARQKLFYKADAIRIKFEELF